MKHKRILAMILVVASCLSLAVGASAANTTTRKATDFRDYDRTAWYAEAVSAAVDNGLLYGKSSTTTMWQWLCRWALITGAATRQWPQTRRFRGRRP